MIGCISTSLKPTRDNIMAKDKKSSKKDKAEKESKAEEREFKFGVEDIADELGIKPASVRVQLRNKGIDKAGKSYGWNSKSELKEVIDQIRSNGDEDKPAKKSKDKKADKSSKKSKKSKKDDDE
jgi:hypothetical protein